MADLLRLSSYATARVAGELRFNRIEPSVTRVNVANALVQIEASGLLHAQGTVDPFSRPWATPRAPATFSGPLRCPATTGTTSPASWWERPARDGLRRTATRGPRCSTVCAANRGAQRATARPTSYRARAATPTMYACCEMNRHVQCTAFTSNPAAVKSSARSVARIGNRRDGFRRSHPLTRRMQAS